MKKTKRRRYIVLRWQGKFTLNLLVRRIERFLREYTRLEFSTLRNDSRFKVVEVDVTAITGITDRRNTSLTADITRRMS